MDDLHHDRTTTAESKTLSCRLGWQAAVTLLLSALVTLAVVGFLGFLWFADLNNGVWHRIMVTGWATRAVSISTLVLRSAIDLQAGIAAAMLAAIILESSSVRLRDAAKVSTMRASSPQPRALLELIPAMSRMEWIFFRVDFLGFSTAVLLLFATTTVLQFSSTVLLSDLHLGSLPGLSANRTSTYDFVYQLENGTSSQRPGLGFSMHFGRISYPIQLRTPTWLRNPPAFPAFAEYTKDVEPSEGVDDTGTLLRGFLPFADAQSRETIRNYSGTAMILDSRVSCQAPKLTDISFSVPKPIWIAGVPDYPDTGRIIGNFEPSIPDVERLWTPGRVPFNCSVFLHVEALTICQVVYLSPQTDSYANSGGLLSEFWNISNSDTGEALNKGEVLWSFPMLVLRSHNATSGDFNKTVLGSQVDKQWLSLSTPSQTWSLSICYSAWNTADLEVSMRSETNRSEPIGFWNPERGYYTQPDVHHQLGDVVDGKPSVESRGILKLEEKTSWIPNPKDTIPNQVQPFVQQFADTSTLTNQKVPVPFACTDCSALMNLPHTDAYWKYDPSGMFHTDYTVSSLFQQALGLDGSDSLARAMSSLITTLSSMAYYDQMPQFGKSSNTSQVFFATVLFPQAHLGFWLIVIVLAAHIALVTLITVGFVACSQYTLLGNHWQSIAQLQGPETEDLLARTRMATDSDVKRALKVAGYENVRVGVRSLADKRGVGLSAVRERHPTSQSHEPGY